MPLDGHNFLVSQGWSGRGNGLRQGAISRPIAIPQKRNLAGLGKDRDEAFPFWDHLFTVASKSIQLKLSGDDELDEETSPSPEIKRTATGIISNRRPMTETSAATSGASIQDVSDGNRRLNLLAIARRDAARTNLYARFLRGPVLAPDTMIPVLPAKLLTGDEDGQTDQKYVKTNNKGTSGDNEEPNISTNERKRNSNDVIARAQKEEERREQKAVEKEERRALRRERRMNDKIASKVTSEDTRRKEKKKRQRVEAREKEKSSCDFADQLLEMKGKKKKKSKKADFGAADIPSKETTLENDECVPTVKSIGMLDHDAAEQAFADHNPINRAYERRKKKRKREEA